ncbi:unnamed protein product, partial [Effrenium voratum]
GSFPERHREVFQKSRRLRIPGMTDDHLLVAAATVTLFATACVYYFALFRHPKAVCFLTLGCLAACVATCFRKGRRSTKALCGALGVALVLGALVGTSCYARFGYFSWLLASSR